MRRRRQAAINHHADAQPADHPCGHAALSPALIRATVDKNIPVQNILPPGLSGVSVALHIEGRNPLCNEYRTRAQRNAARFPARLRRNMPSRSSRRPTYRKNAKPKRSGVARPYCVLMRVSSPRIPPGTQTFPPAGGNMPTAITIKFIE